MTRHAPLANRFVLWLLSSRWRGLAGPRLVGLRYRSRSGASIALPVEAARDGDRVVVLAADAARKQWWRHFRTASSVDVLLDGQWRAGTAEVVTGRDTEPATLYRRSYRRAEVPVDARFVVATLEVTPPPTELLRGWALTRAWFWSVTIAEFLGFAVPAGVGTLTASARPMIAVPALMAAGVVEGSMLGWGQARVLGRAVPGLPRRQWVISTAVAAAVAYLIGLVPSTVGESLASWPLGLIIAAAVVLGAGLLLSIGFAQWLVLRRFVDGAWRWIPATALAWLIGLGVFLAFATPLWQAGQPLALTLAIGLAGGLLMAATTSAVTGVAVRRLLG